MTKYYHFKAVEEKGYECENCGSREEIEVHHRDKNRCNNELGNLIVLCSDCHNTVHHGWPEQGSFLEELMVDTGVKLAKPVYKKAVRKAEQKDSTPAAIIRGWMKRAEKYEKRQRGRR